MEISEEILKRLSPPRCPKCGGSIYLTGHSICPKSFFSGRTLSIYSCISCGFFGYKTNKQCNKCNKDIIKTKTGEDTITKCLGCYNKWSSCCLKSIYIKKARKKIISLEKEFNKILSY